MGLIDSIDEFINQYDGTFKFMVNKKLSSNVLDYYIENFIVNWFIISRTQSFTDTQINKYANEIEWKGLVNNKNVTLTYEIFERNLYSFNLYYLYRFGSILKYKNILYELSKKYKIKFNIDKLEYELNK